MRTEQPTTLQKLSVRLHIKLAQAPQWLATDHSKAVVLSWFSVACFWCRRFGGVLTYVCSCCFSSVWVAWRPPFGEWLLVRLAVCSFCVLNVCDLLVSGFCFGSWFGFWLLRFLVFAYFFL